jgi:hypothetical protein
MAKSSFKVIDVVEEAFCVSPIRMINNNLNCSELFNEKQDDHESVKMLVEAL